MASGFLMTKENDCWHVAISVDEEFIVPYQKLSRLNPNNRFYRFIDNKYGQVILFFDGNYRPGQIALANTNLLPKDKHIDFNFLRKYYIPNLKKIMKEKSIDGESAVNNMKTCLFIIAEKKAYFVNERYGLSDIDHIYASHEILEKAAYYLWDKYPHHDLSFIKEVLNTYYEYYGISLFPVTYFNNKDFLPLEINSETLNKEER